MHSWPGLRYSRCRSGRKRRRCQEPKSLCNSPSSTLQMSRTGRCRMILIDRVPPLFITHYYGYHTRLSWHPSSDPTRPLMKTQEVPAEAPEHARAHWYPPRSSYKANHSKATVISMIHRIGGCVRLCLALPISRSVRRGWILAICLVDTSLVPGSLITILRGQK